MMNDVWQKQKKVTYYKKSSQLQLEKKERLTKELLSYHSQ